MKQNLSALAVMLVLVLGQSAGASGLRQVAINRHSERDLTIEIESTGENSKKYWPVELVCPRKENGGILVLEQATLGGQRTKLAATFVDGRLQRSKVYLAEKGETFRLILQFDTDSVDDADDARVAELHELARNQVLDLKEYICEGTEADRKKYFDALAKNRAIFASQP